MQEIILLLCSLAGVATAAAVWRIPRNDAARAGIGGGLDALNAEKAILEKTMSRLYAEEGIPAVQKSRLLSRYQHQLGVVVSRIEKMEHARGHPDMGAVGDGIAEMLEQRFSKLDDRLHEISSRMARQSAAAAQGAAPRRPAPEPAREPPRVAVPEPASQRRPIEITTLTHVPPGAAHAGAADAIPMDAPRPATPAGMPEDAGADAPGGAAGGRPAASGAPEGAGTIHHARPADDDFDDEDGGDIAELRDNIRKALSRLDGAEVE